MPLLERWKPHQHRLDRESMATIALRSALATVMLGLLSACAKPDQQRAGSGRETAQQVALCPEYGGSTHDWRSTQTADGSLILLVPPLYQAVVTDSGQMWASQFASISYRHGPGRIADTTATSRDGVFCTESLGDGAEMRYYYARAATGEGYYLQAFFRLADGGTLRLIGFSQDSADGTRLLAIARTARRRAP